ncbi:hydroperoxide isomerase ALOXE3-like isoform X1 [Crotalus tigris]|uniref:hydroperoxide isomerase ALOXE3-like isoform X1 n=1 Tax=Crotalus tigris TaxID=88082 RepID=UPI00192F616C|nr:hydroperoxide isomerase ALOXE3-like isoform X1 [Crotalus tigris]XP_039193927.1 hydroperoxide isomerase ALOXE3-like isoform X1 [Crotalus tigris]XP_039193928.1 hydroperoxide isomerase ALOXE3-like isoform X1 [Crotalus tigris]XP_039193929.1 hydroperoxide isomerase ALOXE3-like isoform X1 [Crotalus tigris]
MDQNGSSQKPTVIYKAEVTTGQGLLTGTLDLISVTLVGTKGESPKRFLDQIGMTCSQGSVAEVDIPCDWDLGPILLIRLQKEPYSCFPQSSWYCNKVQVTSPQGELFRFPCYQWIEGYCTVSFREGTAHKPSDDTHALQRRHRQEELQLQQRTYGWKEYLPNTPCCANIDTTATIEHNIMYSFPKATAFFGRGTTALFEAKMKGFLNKPYSWEKLEDIRKIFWFYHNRVSEYVFKHWKDDAFFGYQFLNGINPIKIQKCTTIPENFPVTQEMVAGTLGRTTTLQEELEKGTIYLVDYKVLENVPTTFLNNQKQYIAAPICLLHQKPSGELLPLAIQLSQHPGPQSPIFLPTDEEWLWTLAKTWVRNAEFHTHEVIAHLLRGHLMSEIFAVATLRTLPMCHPLYKLLIPHLRYSIHINVLARTYLISPGGTFDKAIGTGRQGLAVILQRSLAELTYTQLCLPDDIEARGVGCLLQYYYRDDGLKIWEAIQSFVSGIVGLYYKSDSEVQGDGELQSWVAEIFAKGFLSRETSGVPSALHSVPELIKYLTMTIFTCSAHHAAVNGGQFEMGAFMPNLPSSMRKPPPQAKTPVTLQEFLDTIPEMNVTSQVLSVLWVLRNESLDMKPLGYYDEEHFVEEGPKQLISTFQEHLRHITLAIESRNKTLTLPYTYLYPPNIENSTTI